MPQITQSNGVTILVGAGTFGELAGNLKSSQLPVGSSLRLQEVKSRFNNPLVLPPLVAPSLWTGNTVYAVGTVVSNNGNSYICYVSGTSSGSGGPTGTGAAGILDNTVTWFFFGVSSTAISSKIAPILTTTNTNPAGLTNSYRVVTNDGNFLYSGGVPFNQNNGLGYSFPAVNVVGSGNASPHADNHSLGVTFITDAPVVAIGQANNTPSFRIIIDGQYLSLSAIIGSNGANPCFDVLDFTNAGGRKVRVITIESSSAWQFSRVNVDTASKVWAPTEPRTRAMFVGDSYTSGSSWGPYAGRADWPAQVGKLLGWCDPWNLGSGGTGYIADNNGQGFSFINRLSDVVGNRPDIIVVAGGANDSAFSPTAIQSAALSYFQTLRESLPMVPIVVLGVIGSGGPTAAAIAAENAIRAAVNQMTDSLVFFVPVATDTTGAWMTGTGNISAPAGSGNNDVYIGGDGTHLVQNGIDYLAGRVASGLRPVIAAL